jgi:hypothetical protein
MKILVGDDTGLIRNVDVEDSKILTTYGEQAAGMTISSLTRVEEVKLSNLYFLTLTKGLFCNISC